MFSAFTASAQENNSQSNDNNYAWLVNKNDISIGYGYLSLPQFMDEFKSGLFHDHEKYTTSGTINVSYTHILSQRIGLGIDAAYETADISNEKRGYKKAMTYLTVIPTARIYWFHRPNVAMYSKVGLGGCHYTQKMTEKSTTDPYDNDPDESKFCVAAQITVYAVEFGNETIRGYAEGGVGFENGFQVGVRYAF